MYMSYTMPVTFCTMPVTFCTMPVKLEFQNRNNRIHFEKTLRKHCNLKATISLPTPIRRYQSLFLNALRERYREKIVMVRPDTRSLSLVAFQKEDGAGAWLRCRETQPIPRDILLPGFVLPNRIDQSANPTTELCDADDDLLVEASIGAESQTQP
jgi:hypothetical protein